MRDDIILICSVPTWARWLAQDANGEWFVYRDEPHITDTQWLFKTEHPANALMGRVIFRSAPNPNWRDTLVSLD